MRDNPDSARCSERPLPAGGAIGVVGWCFLHAAASIEIDVRVSSQASWRVNGEGVELEAQAHRRGDEATLELAGQGLLSLRFVSPPVAAAEATGDISAVRQERVDGTLALTLRLDGRARVSAR